MRISYDRNSRTPKYIKRNKITVEAEKTRETRIDVRLRLLSETVEIIDKLKKYGGRNEVIERAVDLLFQKEMEYVQLITEWSKE